MVGKGKVLVRGKTKDNTMKDGFMDVGIGKDNAKHMQNKQLVIIFYLKMTQRYFSQSLRYLRITREAH